MLANAASAAAREVPPAGGGHLRGWLRAAADPLAAGQRIRMRRTLRRIGPHGIREMDTINRFRSVAMPIQEDHAAVRGRHPAFRVPFLDWNYWTEGFGVDPSPPVRTGNNILLGNSASPTNNHLEALELLARVLPADRQVVCPLSYGDRHYGDAIETAGRRLLGSRFVPLRDFLAPAAYAEVIASCSVVVMNHLRQQALGNIILALDGGAQVFLHAANPVRAAMRRMGVEVHTLEELARCLDGDPPVAASELEATRRRLRSQYGRPAVLRRTQVLLGQLAEPPGTRMACAG